MTREQIKSLLDGPEMDGLIDELIFGIDRKVVDGQLRSPAIRWHGCLDADCLDHGADYAVDWKGQRYYCNFDKNGPKVEGEGWIWAQRKGKPWQKVVEEIVEEWRMPPSKMWSTDIVAAWEMEEKIGELGLTIEYSKALLSAEPAPACTTGEVDIYEVWHLLHASPEKRCRAALLAVQTGNQR